MSRYTIELRYLIEGNYDLGLKDYPIFDESYREQLNNKIIQHYYFREIGFETEALFKNRLNQKMNEIMPYYNQMYESSKLKIDPLSTIDLEEVFSRKSKTTGEGTSSTSGTGNNTNNFNSTDTTDYGKISKFSDIAQAQTTPNEILNDKYLTSATVDDGQDKNTNTGTNTSQTESTTSGTSTDERNLDEDTTLTRKGNNGTASESELLNMYRETFLNIDMMIIDDLDELFLGIW
ncbi:MAG: hypothetical protein KHW57_08295 [Clostridium sp.]|jgi:hypothetical protein|nr:hypothetical protein [Clostridium sp.]